MSRRSCSRVPRGVLAALVLGSFACTPGKTVRRARNVEQPFRLVVENADWLDMNVYVESESGARLRVGTVAGNTTQAFTVRTLPTGASWFRLVGDPIGSQVLRQSELITLQRGQTAVWRVGQTAATSSLFVR